MYNNNNNNFGGGGYNNSGYNNNNSGYNQGGYNGGGGYNQGGYNNNGGYNNQGGYNNNNNNRPQYVNNNNNDFNNNNNNFGGGGADDDVSNNPDYQSTTRNILQIQGAVTTLTKLVQQLGTPRDSMEIRDKIRNCVESTAHLISSESNKVKNLQSQASRTRDSKNKLLFNKLVKEYNACLQNFKDIAQVATKKEKSTPLPVPPEHQPHNQQQQQQNFGRGGGNSHQNNHFLNNQQPYYDDEREDESQSLMESSRRQQLAQIEAEREYQNSIIQERDEGIRKIEQSIVEINEIFVDLSGLVSEQGVMINTIEASLESTVMNTKDGVSQLREASKHQRSSRTKMCWIVLILLIVCAVLGVILFFTLRK